MFTCVPLDIRHSAFCHRRASNHSGGFVGSQSGFVPFRDGFGLGSFSWENRADDSARAVFWLCLVIFFFRGAVSRKSEAISCKL